MKRKPEPGAGSRLRSFLGVAVLLLLGLLATAAFKSYRDLVRVRTQETELEARIEEARERIRRIDARIERVENDPLTLERLARDELALVRPGDVVIVLPAEAP